MSLKLVRRVALFGLALPFLYFGTASATYLFHIHAENAARPRLLPSLMRAPTAKQRLIVFAPHCDDETLGCGGLLQQAVQVGAAVKVAMITNGDGFRVAVERQFREIHVRPADYVRFANLRQQESFRALSLLGVRQQDVLFLGYPDRGLSALWNDHWTPDRPYQSAYTQCDHSPYPLAYHEGATYCGQSLLQDVESVLISARPTDVYVTHPSDDHPDHSAASAFVLLALRRLRDEGYPWARECRLHYYLVHRGDWPAPQGLQEQDDLMPPAEMAALDTRWSSLPLTTDEESRKKRSILAYPSQTAIMKRFLVSFTRRTELFGDIPESRVPRVPDGSVSVDGNVSEWRRMAATVLDPVNDNLLRDFQAGGDIKAVYACRDTQDLYLRVDTSLPASRRIRFQVRIRYLGDAAAGQAGGSFTAVVTPPSSVFPGGLQTATTGNRTEIAIPLRDIGYARQLALNVETTRSGIQIDRTGYRFLDL